MAVCIYGENCIILEEYGRAGTDLITFAMFTNKHCLVK